MWVNQYPPEYIIPNYCNGQCGAMTGTDAHKIYEMARLTDRNDLRIEDVYYTGILRQKANLTLDHTNHLALSFCYG